MSIQHFLRRQTWTLCATLVAISGSTAARSQSTPQLLLDAAHKASDTTPLIPYELNATVTVNPGGKNTQQGHLTIYRDHDRVRVDLQIAGQKGTRLEVRDKNYQLPQESLLDMINVNSLDRSWDPEPSQKWGFALPEKKFKFSKVSRENIAGADVWCFEKRQDYRKPRFCFDAERGVLLLSSVSSENPQSGSVLRSASNFSEFVSSGQVTYPRKVRITSDNIFPLEASQITITPGQLAESLFAVPSDALELETCEKMTPPRIIRQPEPGYPKGSDGRPHIVGMNIIVGKDGTVKKTQLVRPAGPEFNKRAERAVAAWLFESAKCGGRPVNVAVYVEVEFWKP